MVTRSAELFSEAPRCTQCGRILPDVYEEDDICPVCKEANLFAEVKDFIRENDVREMDVAEHFDIPVSKVRKWIRCSLSDLWKTHRIWYIMPGMS